MPACGGIILPLADRREQIEESREDPFYAQGLVDIRVIEFRASQRSDASQRLFDR